MRGQPLLRLRRLSAQRVCGVMKQPGEGTHVVDGRHEEEDDADDVNGKDGSQEDQHDGLLEAERERERGGRKLVTPLFFVVAVEENQRANWAEESAEPRTSAEAETRLRKRLKGRLGSVSGRGFFDF